MSVFLEQMADYNNGDTLRILLIGNGGREHALGWKLVQSPSVEALFVAPGMICRSINLAYTALGNGGTVALEKSKNVDIGVTEFEELVRFAQENDVNLVIPGPEVPLVEGIETWFRRGLFSLWMGITSSRDTLLWPYSKSRTYGRIQGILQGFHDTT
jgi:Phosphoribosylglycinamide synthetase, N domain